MNRPSCRILWRSFGFGFVLRQTRSGLPRYFVFYLLVTPEIRMTGMPQYMAVVLLSFPLIFFGVLINSRYYIDPMKRNILMVVILGVLKGFYLS